MSLFVQIEKKLPQFNLEISFETDNGTLGILGGSGSGKSMTLRCIAGLETPTSGRIVLNNRVLFDSANGINVPARQRNVGLLFQNYALFPHLNVLENINFGLKSTSKARDIQKLKENIISFRLEGLEDRFPHQLSGGQQQRVALARAAVMEPELLLLDEPFSALDNYLRSQLEQELIEVLDRFAGSALFVSHNLEETYLVCQDLMILDNGRKIAYGEKEALFKNPPNYTAAQVTGCRNLCPAKVIAPDTIEAADWGCRLRVATPPNKVTHVGIRAHHLTFVDNPGPDNVFPCRLTKTTETPFGMILNLTLDSSPDNANNNHLQAEIFKEQWLQMKDRPFPWLVHLDPDQLFLTNEV